MIWIVICTVMSVAFGHIMRNAQARRRSMPWVGAWNYALAALGCWAWWALRPVAPLSHDAVLFGTLTGASFVVAYYLLDACIRAAGVGITVAVTWLSVAVPIAASIVIWAEIPGTVQSCGIALALIALPFLAFGQALPENPRHSGKIWLLGLVFLAEAMATLFMKAYSKRAPSGFEMPYLCFVFTGAAVGSLVLAARAERARWPEIPHGLALGATNVIANFAFLCALEALPGTVVFPTMSVATILLSSAVAAILWRERYRGWALIGLAIATIALVLVNL